MMIVLKLISISMDYQDGMTGKKNTHSFSKMPSVIEYAGYLGGLNGIMVGPHFYYDEYMQYANNLGHYETLGTSKFPKRTFPAVKALCCSVLCAGLFAVSTTYIPRGAVMFGNNQDMLMIKRIPLSILANLGYRARFYFAWMMAESAYICSGFGFSGYDEEGKPTWTRAINAPFRRIEFSPSAAYVVTQWNIHTGKWLRYYIYDRLGGAGFWPLLVTQVISGIWHGFTAGYVVFFINSAIMIHASRMLYRIQKDYLPKKYNRVANEVHRIHTLYNLNYVSGSYAAGNIYRCLGWFSSQYYFGHIEMLGVIVVVTLFFPSKKKLQQKAKIEELAPATEAEQKKAK
jgi:lysophospholipid acyltransferase